MLSNLVQLKHIVGEKAIHLICDNDTEIPSIREALCKFLSYVQQVEDKVKEQQAAQQTKPVEEIKPVEENPKEENGQS